MSTTTQDGISTEQSIQADFESSLVYEGKFGLPEVRQIQKQTDSVKNASLHEQIRQHGKYAMLNGLSVSKEGFKGEKSVLGFGQAHGAVPTYMLGLRVGANWHNSTSKNYLFYMDGDFHENREKNEAIGKLFDWSRSTVGITSQTAYRKNKQARADMFMKLAGRLTRDMPKILGIKPSELNSKQVTLITPTAKSANGMTKRIISFKQWASTVTKLAVKNAKDAKIESTAEAEAQAEIEDIQLSEKEIVAETKAQLLSNAIEKSMNEWKIILLEKPELKTTEFGISMDNLSKAVKSV